MLESSCKLRKRKKIMAYLEQLEWEALAISGSRNTTNSSESQTHTTRVTGILLSLPSHGCGGPGSPVFMQISWDQVWGGGFGVYSTLLNPRPQLLNMHGLTWTYLITYNYQTLLALQKGDQQATQIKLGRSKKKVWRTLPMIKNIEVRRKHLVFPSSTSLTCVDDEGAELLGAPHLQHLSPAVQEVVLMLLLAEESVASHWYAYLQHRLCWFLFRLYCSSSWNGATLSFLCRVEETPSLNMKVTFILRVYMPDFVCNLLESSCKLREIRKNIGILGTIRMGGTPHHHTQHLRVTQHEKFI